MNFNNTFDSTFNTLDFIRPYWLLGILIVLAFYLLRYQRNKYKQTDIIANHLSEHLVTLPETTKNNRLALNSLIIIACIALSGPSIRSVETPVYEMQKAQVIALDLSYSMYATDIKPDRLSQAKYKAIDLLKQWTEGEKALIAYAGDAFTISPLTSDSNAIINHIPHLSPQLMPAQGSRPDLALEKAISLLKNAGHQQGHIVFITDGFDSESLDNMNAIIKDSKWIVSVLAMATAKGAPIKLPEGGLLKDNAGKIIIPTLNADMLYPVTRINNGLYLTSDVKGEDIQLLATHYSNENQRKENEDSQQQADNKQLIDDGYWFSFLLIPLFLLFFRKGVFYLALLAITLPLTAPKLEASIWKNDQQNALQAFQEGEYKEASEAFEDQEWKATALFKDKQYKQAEAAYLNQHKAAPTDANILYNLGNAQAMQKNYKEALESYNQALNINPDLEQAKTNKNAVQTLLKQQEKQQNKEQKNKEKQDSSDEQESKEQQDASDEQESKEQQDSSDEQQQSQEQQDSSDEQQSQEQQDSSDEQQSQEQQDSSDEQQQSQEQQDSSDEQKSKEQQAAEQAESEQKDAKEADNAEDEQQQIESESTPENAEPSKAILDPSNSEQEINEEYEELPIWLKNMPDDPSLLLRNKMRLEYRKRSANKPVLHNNDGDIW